MRLVRVPAHRFSMRLYDVQFSGRVDEDGARDADEDHVAVKKSKCTVARVIVMRGFKRAVGNALKRGFEVLHRLGLEYGNSRDGDAPSGPDNGSAEKRKRTDDLKCLHVLLPLTEHAVAAVAKYLDTHQEIP
jgi:hypothetical protein